ncbi:DNA translocase FtsK [Oceanobacillus halophilus]|uniref:DNA translocase FtsK n=1 Tax=Oceanobacillus halophilus TaxID=930130 RepID=A0A494ZVH4_9BACI|nr:DNA translocase FtsK [Oceanobacillus halophilus]RKQ30530.1 DNA translocase FtsK [Oceanobacillus halophilus]
MWEKWKKKIKELFTDNEEETTPIDAPVSRERDHGKQNIQARVSYKYPKPKSFRFPVIPDENEPIKRKDKRDNREKRVKENNRSSVYERKRVDTPTRDIHHKLKRNVRDSSNNNQQKENIHTAKNNKQQTTLNSNKIYKKTDKPFEVTEVPSPIYGFRKPNKQEKEIQDVPAFVRNADKREKEKSDSKDNNEQKSIHTDGVSAFSEQVASTVEQELDIEENLESVNKYKINPVQSHDSNIKRTEEIMTEQKETKNEWELSEETDADKKTEMEEQQKKDETPESTKKEANHLDSYGDIQQHGDGQNMDNEDNANSEGFSGEKINQPDQVEEDTESRVPFEELSMEENEMEEATEKSKPEEPIQEEITMEQIEASKYEPIEEPTKEEHIEEKEVEVVNKKQNPDYNNESSSTQENKPYVFPFNVIMTPSDKRNLRKRELETKNKQVNNNHPDKQNEVKEDKPKLFEEASPVSKKFVPSEVRKEEETTDKHIPYHLLNDPVPSSNDNQIWVEQQQCLLEQTLKHFNVRANVVKATQGPSVTRFEVHPELGVKVSKIKNLSDDLKLNMAAEDIRIEAPIPGKNTVGIEIPNQKAQMVGLQEIFETEEFKDSESPLTIALGLSIEGEPKITNIQKMPHGLIAGATGSGKSVCINTMLISLIYKASHEDVKILLIDPKMVELAPYNGIPHLVAPVITDVKAATQSLKWAVNEMEDRYGKFVHEGVRNIEGYNKKMKQQGRMEEKMPFIVIVIDELADLMMTSPQDVEDSISRIAQKARACGIHLILATQRPSVDVITGLIKANIPTRIAFSVSSQVDSRTIIDVSGAEKLLGKGDMLFVENGASKSIRLQGPFVSDEEIERVTNYARSIAEPNYLFEQDELLEQVHVDEEEDELLQEVIDFVLNQNSASTSMIQRRFKIGYNRAARLIDTLEYRGIISGQNGSKPRDVLITQKQEEL